MSLLSSVPLLDLSFSKCPDHVQEICPMDILSFPNISILILLFRLLALSYKHFWELTAEVEFWPVLGEPFGGFWLMEWNEIDLIRQCRSFYIRGNGSLSDMPIARERRETVDFAPVRITTKELQGRPLVLQKNSKKPFLPTWHQLPLVNFYHPNATFKTFLLQKKCYKCSSHIPALQGRKYLRSSFAVFNFPLFLVGVSGQISVCWFSPLSVWMEPGNCYSHGQYSSILVCPFHFRKMKKNISLLLSPCISKDMPRSAPRGTAPRGTAPRGTAFLPITAYSTRFQAGN